MTHTEELVASRRAIEEKIKGLKSEITEIDKALEFAAWPIMEQRLLTDKKEHGEFKLDVDGVTIKGVIRKTINWNSDKLKNIAATLHPEDAAEIFDVKITIPEKNYNILLECDHPALGEIMMAREVKLSPFSIKIEQQ
jgi:hypothetical protein